MLTQYISAAMRCARYEIFEDGTYYGEIPPVEGVCANEPTLEGCRDALASALEGWIMLSIRKQLPIPVIDGINLNVPSEAA